MKKIILIITLGFVFSFLGCTKQSIKNRALFLSVEKFDNEAQVAGKENFVDAEQQNVFSEFIKVNTRIDVSEVELQNENEATARLTVETFPKSLYSTLKTISGKEWKEKVKAAKERKTYLLKMKKTNGDWEIIEQKEIP
ncbi:MAG TPA: hypothetical protein VIG33_01250 [Pseudobdellovibrionaceae bacterium]|jgi:hypothetical protein